MATKLYDADFYGWTQEQARLLRLVETTRLNAPPELDWANLAEEIEDLGKNKLDELYSRYVMLICLLLKWRYQPGMRSSSWSGTINEQRARIARLRRKNPSLKPKRLEEFKDAYDEARGRAIAETGLKDAIFPRTCPFVIDDVENEQFWPEPADLVERKED